MTPTFGTRLAALRAARQLTQHELAAASGVSRSRIAVLERSAGLPHATTVARLAKALGVRVSALYGAPDEPTPPPTLPAAPAAAPPYAATYSGDVLDRLLSQINSQAQQHREELASLKREHRAATNAQARTAQYNMDAMHAKVHFLEGRLGLRPFTAEELAQAAQLAAATPPAKKIGLKHYDESAPTGRYGRHLSMAGVQLGGLSTARAA